MKKKIIARVNTGDLVFSDWVQEPNELKVGNCNELVLNRLDQEISRYVGYISLNKFGYGKTQRDRYGRKHIPKTILKLEQLLYIKYGIKIEVEI